MRSTTVPTPDQQATPPTANGNLSKTEWAEIAAEQAEIHRLALLARQQPVVDVGPPSGPAYEMHAWLADHPEVLDGYAFEWVAVADKRVVARGETIGEAADAAIAQGFDDPLLVPLFPYVRS